MCTHILHRSFLNSSANYYRTQADNLTEHYSGAWRKRQWKIYV